MTCKWTVEIITYITIVTIFISKQYTLDAHSTYQQNTIDFFLRYLKMV